MNKFGVENIEVPVCYATGLRYSAVPILILRQCLAPVSNKNNLQEQFNNIINMM